MAMTELYRSAALAAVLAMGCGEPDSTEETQGAALPILDGAVDDATSAVVFVMPAICSGTVIAPNLVLTAQHCVAPLKEAPDAELEGCYPSVFKPPVPAGSVSVYTGNPAGGVEEQRHRVLEIVLPPYTTPVNQICGNDVAMLILEAPIAPDVVMPINPRVDIPVSAGEPYSALGFGKIDPDVPVDTKNAVRYRRDGLEAECAGDGCTSLPGYVVSSEWRGDGATCGGDSGGPAIDAAGRVIGVDSRNNGCGTYTLYGGVEPHGAWIRETAIRAAELGGYAPPLWSIGWPSDPAYSSPVGAACEAATDCPSGLCVDAICTRRCGEATPCPDGYLCGESEQCEVVEEAPAEEGEPKEGGETDAGEEDGCSVSGAWAAHNEGAGAAWTMLLAALFFMTRRSAGRARAQSSVASAAGFASGQQHSSDLVAVQQVGPGCEERVGRPFG
jgi:hypothetical protein